MLNRPTGGFGAAHNSKLKLISRSKSVAPTPLIGIVVETKGIVADNPFVPTVKVSVIGTVTLCLLPFIDNSKSKSLNVMDSAIIGSSPVIDIVIPAAKLDVTGAFIVALIFKSGNNFKLCTVILEIEKPKNYSCEYIS
jgi:hypothetical protein